LKLFELAISQATEPPLAVNVLKSYNYCNKLVIVNSSGISYIVAKGLIFVGRFELYNASKTS
jgi:hypothetical protein